MSEDTKFTVGFCTSMVAFFVGCLLLGCSMNESAVTSTKSSYKDCEDMTGEAWVSYTNHVISEVLKYRDQDYVWEDNKLLPKIKTQVCDVVKMQYNVK